VLVGVSSATTSHKYGAEEENECRFCYKFKYELDLALQELSSVKKIIQILQEERNSIPYLNTVSTGNENASVDQNFEIVMTKSGRKKLTSYKSEDTKIMKMQLNQSTLTTENKYATLASLQAEQETSQNNSKFSNTSITMKKSGCSTIVRKRKIIIIGDSHTRGMAYELKNSLGKGFEVNGPVMPGARLENIISLSAKGISTLGNMQ
jgi:hypothetical protein